jgi:hypothetical protein
VILRTMESRLHSSKLRGSYCYEAADLRKLRFDWYGSVRNRLTGSCSFSIASSIARKVKHGARRFFPAADRNAGGGYLKLDRLQVSCAFFGFASDTLCHCDRFNSGALVDRQIAEPFA